MAVFVYIAVQGFWFFMERIPLSYYWQDFYSFAALMGAKSFVGEYSINGPL